MSVPSRVTRFVTDRAVVAVLWVIIGMVVFGAGVRIGYEVLSDKVACFNEYADKNATAVEARQDATQTRDDKQLAVVMAQGVSDQAQIVAYTTVLNPDSTREEIRAALQAAVDAQTDSVKAKTDLVTAYNELTKQRLENPYPDPPREVCP